MCTFYANKVMFNQLPSLHNTKLIFRKQNLIFEVSLKKKKSDNKMPLPACHLLQHCKPSCTCLAQFTVLGWLRPAHVQCHSPANEEAWKLACRPSMETFVPLSNLRIFKVELTDFCRHRSSLLSQFRKLQLHSIGLMEAQAIRNTKQLCCKQVKRCVSV